MGLPWSFLGKRKKKKKLNPRAHYFITYNNRQYGLGRAQPQRVICGPPLIKTFIFFYPPFFYMNPQKTSVHLPSPTLDWKKKPADMCLDGSAGLPIRMDQSLCVVWKSGSRTSVYISRGICSCCLHEMCFSPSFNLEKRWNGTFLIVYGCVMEYITSRPISGRRRKSFI